VAVLVNGRADKGRRGASGPNPPSAKGYGDPARPGRTLWFETEKKGSRAQSSGLRPHTRTERRKLSDSPAAPRTGWFTATQVEGFSSSRFTRLGGCHPASGGGRASAAVCASMVGTPRRARAESVSGVIWSLWRGTPASCADSDTAIVQLGQTTGSILPVIRSSCPARNENGSREL
jgi:hypothetical protein